MMSSVSNVLATESANKWPEKLLKLDPTARSLVKVFTLLSENECGKRETALLQRFIETIRQAVPSQRIVVSSARITRADTALERLIIKGIAKKATELLPASIWGKIGRELVNTSSDNSVLSLSATCKALRGEEYWIEALHDVAILNVREAIKAKKPLVPESFFDGKRDFVIPIIFRQMHALYLSHFHELQVSAKFLERLARTFAKVTYLNLQSSKMSEGHFRAILAFKDLQEIDLSDCEHYPKHLALLAPTLKRVTISHNKQGDEMVDNLKQLHLLEELDLSHKQALTVSALIALQAFPNLRKVQIQASSLTAEDMHALPVTIRELTCDKAVAEAARLRLPSCHIKAVEVVGCSIM